jgi:opacity protein-like surface antigen
MKKTIITAALVAALASAVNAADYDNTTVSMAAESATKGIELSTNDTSRSISVYTLGRSLDLGAKMADNGTNRDFSLSAGKTISLFPLGPLGTYVAGNVEYNWGDTFTSAEMHFTPTAGVSADLGVLAPFAEVSYELKSIEGDFTDINKVAPKAVFGTAIELNASTTLTAKLTQSLNQDWKSTDKEIGVGLKIKF